MSSLYYVTLASSMVFSGMSDMVVVGIGMGNSFKWLIWLVMYRSKNYEKYGASVTVAPWRWGNPWDS